MTRREAFKTVVLGAVVAVAGWWPKVRSRYSLCGTRTGRLSTALPNLSSPPSVVSIPRSVASPGLGALYHYLKQSYYGSPMSGKSHYLKQSYYGSPMSGKSVFLTHLDDYACACPMRIRITGAPKSGKTTLAYGFYRLFDKPVAVADDGAGFGTVSVDGQFCTYIYTSDVPSVLDDVVIRTHRLRDAFLAEVVSNRFSSGPRPFVRLS